MTNFKCLIIAQTQTLFDGVVHSVKVPGLGGHFEMLAHHCGIVSSLGSGSVYLKDQEGVKEFKISNGLCQFANNVATILITEAVS